jgi:hypothetical protein
LLDRKTDTKKRAHTGAPQKEARKEDKLGKVKSMRIECALPFFFF